MSTPGFNIDSRSILVDKLGQNMKKFELSNLILKNGKGLKAVYEIDKIRAELVDFAKDPSIGLEKLGPAPRQPNIEGMTEEEAEQAKAEYLALLEFYEMTKQALTAHVPVEDMITINNYMEPFESTLHATPAVKGKRFHAFTKDVTEEQGGLFGNMFKRNRQQQG